MLDYMTIRDLVEFGDSRGDLPLVVVLMAMFAGLQEGSLCLNLDQRQFLNHLAAEDQKNCESHFRQFFIRSCGGQVSKTDNQKRRRIFAVDPG